jgi:hypothetical protein
MIKLFFSSRFYFKVDETNLKSAVVKRTISGGDCGKCRLSFFPAGPAGDGICWNCAEMNSARETGWVRVRLTGMD